MSAGISLTQAIQRRQPARPEPRTRYRPGDRAGVSFRRHQFNRLPVLNSLVGPKPGFRLTPYQSPWCYRCQPFHSPGQETIESVFLQGEADSRHPPDWISSRAETCLPALSRSSRAGDRTCRGCAGLWWPSMFGHCKQLKMEHFATHAPRSASRLNAWKAVDPRLLKAKSFPESD